MSALKSVPPPLHLPQSRRILVFGLYVATAWVCFYSATGSAIPAGSGASVWFLALTAHWLLALLAAPFFLPPRDSLGIALGTILLIAPIDLTSAAFSDQLILTARLTIAVAVFVAALATVASFRIGTVTGGVCYRLSALLGKSEVLLTPAVIISALGFYPGRPGWTAGILALWVVAITVRPIERAFQIAAYVQRSATSVSSAPRVGTLLRVDDPDIVRVALTGEAKTWTPTTVHVARLPNGESRYVLPLFMQIQNEELIGTGLCCPMTEQPDEALEVGSVQALGTAGLGNQLLTSMSGDGKVDRVVGIVVEGSSIGSLRFHVVRDSLLQEGTVVYGVVRGQKVYYQVLDADTREESFQQQPLGVHIASAAQLGTHDERAGFQKFPWLPEMNRPLFLLPCEGVPPGISVKGEFSVGTVPNTPFGVSVKLADLIEYHTAVLGVTGTGKTELTLDIIRQALDEECKVFCVDLTGEYKTRLADRAPEEIGLSLEQGSRLADLLFAVETGTYGAPKEKEMLKKFIDGIRPQVSTQLDTFLSKPGPGLGVFELAEITNTKATLRTTELYLSAIMDWARRHRKARRVLIVLEEAHTIIPEAYASGFDSETQWVVGRIGQIALQGRKYGVGLLLVSQRTALVSKTVLSQCNTLFTHALVDKTSLDFLSGVYGPEHVRVLPNLRFLDFIAHGKAIKSERPLLARRTFDPEKQRQDQALNVRLPE